MLTCLLLLKLVITCPITVQALLHMSRVGESSEALLDRRDTPINFIQIEPHTAHGLNLQAGRVVEDYHEQ